MHWKTLDWKFGDFSPARVSWKAVNLTGPHVVFSSLKLKKKERREDSGLGGWKCSFQI
jgi:hypothetical protein